MKAEEFAQVLGGIREEYLAEAEGFRRGRKPGWGRWAALAACLGLVPRLTAWGGAFFARRPGLRTAAMLLLLALCLAALMKSSYNPFLYFRF